MAHDYAIVSSATSTDRLRNLDNAACHLSDGTVVFLTLSSSGAAIEMWYRPSGGSPVQITSDVGFFPATDASATVCCDTSNNLFVVGGSGALATVYARAYTKGSGYNWTAQTLLSTATVSNASMGAAAYWANTGGTNAKGIVVAFLGGRDAVNTGGRVFSLDAGVLLQGSGTVKLSDSAPPGVAVTSGPANANLDLTGDSTTPGATSGVAVVRNTAGNLVPFSWSVNSSGVFTLAALTAYAAVNGKARIVRTASNVFSIACGDSTANRIKVSRYSATAQLTAPAAWGAGVTNMPSPAASVQWDVFYDSNTSLLWVYAWSTGDAQNLIALDCNVSAGVTWNSIVTAIASDVGDTSSATNTTLRVGHGNPMPVAEWQAFTQVGSTYELTGGDSVYNVAPSAPTLGTPTSATNADLATPTFTATFVDTNTAAGDVLSGLAMRRKIGAGSYEYWSVGNMLAANEAVLSTDPFNWSADDVNTTRGRSSAITYNGRATLSLTAVGPGSVNARTAAGISGKAVFPGETYTALASIRGSAARTIEVGIRWYTAAGVTLSTSYGSTATASTTGFGQVTCTTTAPADAHYAAVIVTGLGLAAGDVLYATQMSLAPGSDTTWRASGVYFFQATQVFNPYTAPSNAIAVAFPAGAWANANTAYSWSMATRDTFGGATGAFAADATVTGSATPIVSAVTVSSTSTLTPTITYTYTQADGNVQVARRLKVFKASTVAAAGFDPSQAVGAGEYDSTRVVSATTSFTSGALTNGVAYVAYVQAEQTGSLTSAWTAGTQFTPNVTPPSAPTLTAAADNTNARVLLTVTGTHATASFPTTVFLVEYSDDSGASWTTVRGASALPGSGTPGPVAATVYDYESKLNTARQYRAKTLATVGAGTLTSNASATQSATVVYTGWWLKDPTAPAVNAAIDRYLPEDVSTFESQGVFLPLGATYPIVVADTVGSENGVLNVECWTQAQFDAVETLRNTQRTLLLQSPLGLQWYVRLGAELKTTMDWAPDTNRHRLVSIGYVEVAVP